MVTFSDCKIVKDARQLRVNRILASSPSARNGSSGGFDSLPQSAVGLPLQVRLHLEEMTWLDYFVLPYSYHVCGLTFTGIALSVVTESVDILTPTLA